MECSNNGLMNNDMTSTNMSSNFNNYNNYSNYGMGNSFMNNPMNGYDNINSIYNSYAKEERSISRESSKYKPRITYDDLNKEITDILNNSNNLQVKGIRNPIPYSPKMPMANDMDDIITTSSTNGMNSSLKNNLMPKNGKNQKNTTPSKKSKYVPKDKRIEEEIKAKLAAKMQGKLPPEFPYDGNNLINNMNMNNVTSYGPGNRVNNYNSNPNMNYGNNMPNNNPMNNPLNHNGMNNVTNYGNSPNNNKAMNKPPMNDDLDLPNNNGFISPMNKQPQGQGISVHLHKDDRKNIFKYYLHHYMNDGWAAFYCSDKRCTGSAKYNIESKKFEIYSPHSLTYGEHFYVNNPFPNDQRLFKEFQRRNFNEAQLFKQPNGKSNIYWYNN